MAMDYVRSVDSNQHICQHFLVMFLKWNHQEILLPSSLYMYIHMYVCMQVSDWSTLITVV